MFPTRPAGCRFCPTDQQLITYLSKMVHGNPPLDTGDVLEINVYGNGEWKKLFEILEEDTLYFFTILTRMSPTSKRISRVAENGTWKGQNISDIIDNDITIGSNRYFSFIPSGFPQPCGLGMHEYRLKSSNTDNLHAIGKITKHKKGSTAADANGRPDDESMRQGFENWRRDLRALMDNNNWRPTPPGGEPNMETSDWRTQLQPDLQQRIVNKIMDTLERHLPFSGPVGLNVHKKIAARIEEKIYTAATNQLDYLWRIYSKMHLVESKSQSTISNSLQPNNGGTSNNPPDPGSVMQNQVHNQGKSLPIPLSANQPQPRQQLLSQNIQSSSGLHSVLPSASGLNQTPVSSVVGQNSNMQNISTVSQNVVGSSMGQGAPQQSVGVHQQQTPVTQQTMMAPQQQQQQLMGQSNAANMQQNQLTGQQNSVGDMQQQQQQQRLLGQHSNLPNLQQQQLMGQQSLSSLHHQQLGSQSNVSGLLQQQQQQQQQLLGTQSGNSNMPTNQHSVHILQQPKVPMQQQPQQSAPNLLSSQGQQSQPQSGQQQLMSQIQSQPAQLQQQLGLHQQPNALQRDMQQRLQASSQASGFLLQPQNVVDQQKQLYQSQRALPETSSRVSTAQHNMLNSLESGSDSGQGNTLNSLQQVVVGSLPQNSVTASHQENINTLSSQSGVNMFQSNINPLQPNSAPLAPSPMPGDSEKPISGISSFSNAGNIGHQQTTSAQVAAPSLAIGTPGISASPLLAEITGPDGTHGTALTTVPGKSSATEQPLERLVKAVKSMSPKALSASVSDIGSVVSMTDGIAGSAPGNGSRAAVGEGLVAMIKCRLQTRNFIIQDGMTGPRKRRRYTSAMPLNVVSSARSVSSNSVNQLIGAETSDLESTATSGIKRPRIEANHLLLEEIREINQRLIDTVVDISDKDVDPTAAAEGGEGTIVKCSFNAVALSPDLKSQYASSQKSPIQPLRLLVPTNYPNCSPILLDEFPVEVSKEYEDVSVKAKSRFSISLRSLTQRISLGDIARTWDDYARTVISEYAQQSGGSSFSSNYGTWEDCLSGA